LLNVSTSCEAVVDLGSDETKMAVLPRAFLCLPSAPSAALRFLPFLSSLAATGVWSRERGERHGGSAEG